MPDDGNNNDTTQNDQNAGADQTGDQSGNQGNPEYPEGLGDAGKRAIDRMKGERDDAKRDYATLKSDYEALKARVDAFSNPDRNGGNQNDNKGNGDTKTGGRSAEDVENNLFARMAAQALRSTVRESAKGKLADPEDALRFLDLSDMQPNEFGEHDSSAINQKIEDLLKAKPYLKVAKAEFQGGADGGPRGDSTAKTQLSREDLKTMTSVEINKARSEGRLDNILAGKS